MGMGALGGRGGGRSRSRGSAGTIGALALEVLPSETVEEASNGERNDKVLNGGACQPSEHIDTADLHAAISHGKPREGSEGHGETAEETEAVTTAVFLPFEAKNLVHFLAKFLELCAVLDAELLLLHPFGMAGHTTSTAHGHECGGDKRNSEHQAHTRILHIPEHVFVLKEGHVTGDVLLNEHETERRSKTNKTSNKRGAKKTEALHGVVSGADFTSVLPRLLARS